MIHLILCFIVVSYFQDWRVSCCYSRITDCMFKLLWAIRNLQMFQFARCFSSVSSLELSLVNFILETDIHSLPAAPCSDHIVHHVTFQPNQTASFKPPPSCVCVCFNVHAAGLRLCVAFCACAEALISSTVQVCRPAGLWWIYRPTLSDSWQNCLTFLF